MSQSMQGILDNLVLIPHRRYRALHGRQPVQAVNADPGRRTEGWRSVDQSALSRHLPVPRVPGTRKRRLYSPLAHRHGATALALHEPALRAPTTDRRLRPQKADVVTTERCLASL